MATRIQVVGGDDLRRKLRAISDEVRPAVVREVKATALNIQAGARERLTEQEAVDTGRLRNSIAIEELLGGLDARIGTNVEYAEAIEFGLPPGTHPNPAELVGWVRRKLGIADSDRAQGIAHAIAQKIEKFGTHAQPYLHPAAEQERRPFAARMIKAVGRALDRARR